MLFTTLYYCCIVKWNMCIVYNIRAEYKWLRYFFYIQYKRFLYVFINITCIYNKTINHKVLMIIRRNNIHYFKLIFLNIELNVNNNFIYWMKKQIMHNKIVVKLCQWIILILLNLKYLFFVQSSVTLIDH